MMDYKEVITIQDRCLFSLRESKPTPGNENEGDFWDPAMFHVLDSGDSYMEVCFMISVWTTSSFCTLFSEYATLSKLRKN